MIWSDRFGLWMDPDDRTPEEKRRHEEIAAEFEERAKKALQEEHYFCPECKYTHASVDQDGCCTQCGADCETVPCSCPPEVLAKAMKRTQELMRRGLDPKSYDFETIAKVTAPLWRTWTCPEHGGFDDLIGLPLPLSDDQIHRLRCGCMRGYNESAREIHRLFLV